MRIRKASLNDLPSLLTLFANARRFMAEHGNAVQWGTSYPSEETLKNDIALERSWLVEDEGHILASFMLLMDEDPNYATIEGKWKNDRKYATLHRVASSGEKPGMADIIIKWAWGVLPNLRGDTHELNIPMQRAFERNGFERCGIVHMADGTPRIAYQKER